jgi:signal transduction histidine kinase
MQKRMDEALLQQLRRSQDAELGLRNALDAASIGYWSWITNEAMQWDAHMLRLFGINRDQIPASLDDFLLLLDDDSQEAAIEGFEAALTQNRAFSLDIVAEKTRMHLHLSSRPYLLPGAASQALSGLCREISPPEGKASTGQDTTMELANFASVASHDLREPLRMVTSYLRLLEERSPDSLDERAQRYIKYACEGADRMRSLIEDLLSYARLDSEAEPPRPIALAETLEETLNILSTSIRESKADVTLTLEKSALVMGDRTSLVRLFQNLIGNAIKFHAEGKDPKVEIGVEDGDEKGATGFWIVFVKDYGIGVDPEHHELLFNIFQRLHTRDEFEGSGIGLASCRKIVERLGGSISFDSRKGVGSIFRVKLKKANFDNEQSEL